MERIGKAANSFRFVSLPQILPFLPPHGPKSIKFVMDTKLITMSQLTEGLTLPL